MARMTRTQIMLDPRQMELLERRSKVTGKSKSELIREAIDVTYDRDAERARRKAALDRFLYMERPPRDQIAPKDTSPGWRERLHERPPRADD